MTRRVLMISGSLRTASTSSAVLRTAAAVAPPDVEAVLYEGLARLPHFNPDDDADTVDPAVMHLRDAIHVADALLFSTPEYAGTLPGSFKNLLDWTIGDDQRGSIYEKSVGWINASPRGAQGAHYELRKVLGYAHATIVEAACTHVPVSSSAIGADGLIGDVEIRRVLRATIEQLVCETPKQP